MLTKLKDWARRLKSEVGALQAAALDARTPWYARLLAVIVIAYALSPLDLIPDFIPVLGYLDDLLLIPFGLWAVRSLIPADVLAEHRASIAEGHPLRRSYTAGVVIALIWIAALVASALWVWRRLSPE